MRPAQLLGPSNLIRRCPLIKVESELQHGARRYCWLSITEKAKRSEEDRAGLARSSCNPVRKPFGVSADRYRRWRDLFHSAGSVPILGAIVAIYGLFGDTGALRTHLEQLSTVPPGGALDVIGDQLKRVAEGEKSTLGLAFLLSLAISLWSANAGIKALFDALNIVYGAKEKRGFIKLNAVSLTFTIGAIGFLVLALALLVVLPTALRYFGIEEAMERIAAIARWPLLLIAITFALSLIYRFGPSRDNAQWHWITVGSAIAAILWLASSMAFSYYAANFGSYNQTYGSLGAIIGFMTWLWLSVLVVLGGAEIDAILEQADRGTAK
jgi:membrane protein